MKRLGASPYRKRGEIQNVKNSAAAKAIIENRM
jgi:hypothetical protein